MDNRLKKGLGRGLSSLLGDTHKKVETNKVSPQWIEKAQHVKKIIVVSEHSKNVYNDTVYVATDKSTGRQMSISNKTPIDAVGYPVREIDTGQSPMYVSIIQKNLR